MAYGIDDYRPGDYDDDLSLDSPGCDNWGADSDGDMGTFWDQTLQTDVDGPIGGNVWAHAQCGIDAGLPLA